MKGDVYAMPDNDENVKISRDRARDLWDASSESVSSELDHAASWLRMTTLPGPADYWDVEAVAGAVGALANAWGCGPGSEARIRASVDPWTKRWTNWWSLDKGLRPRWRATRKYIWCERCSKRCNLSTERFVSREIADDLGRASGSTRSGPAVHLLFGVLICRRALIAGSERRAAAKVKREFLSRHQRCEFPLAM